MKTTKCELEKKIAKLRQQAKTAVLTAERLPLHMEEEFKRRIAQSSEWDAEADRLETILNGDDDAVEI